MKKIVIFVAMIAFAIATQAQTAIKVESIPTPESFDLSADDQTVSLSHSSDTVVYQLYKMDENGNYVPCSDPIKGTNGPLTWNVDTGNYSATGSYVNYSGCSSQMNGEVTVPTEKVVVSETLLPADEDVVTEETSWDPLNIIPIVFFSLVIVLLVYGIIKRKKNSFGEHKEMKAPLTGTVKRSKR